MHALPLLAIILLSLAVDLYLYVELYAGEPAQAQFLLGASAFILVGYAFVRTTGRLLGPEQLPGNRQQGYLAALLLLSVGGGIMGSLLIAYLKLLF